LDTPPLKLLDAVKHSVEDKRFFLSEQLLNVGYHDPFLVNTAVEHAAGSDNSVFVTQAGPERAGVTLMPINGHYLTRFP